MLLAAGYRRVREPTSPGFETIGQRCPLISGLWAR